MMNDDYASLSHKLYEELDVAQREALERQGLIEPTKDEKRNGWTAETLTMYLAERTAGQSLAIDPHSLHRRMARRPRVQNDRYNPLKWRG